MKRPFFTFVLYSYMIFFLFFIVIGISMWIGVPSSITYTLQIISAWSSTLAFVLLFRRIYPQTRMQDFLKNLFTERLKFSVLVFVIGIPVVILVMTVESDQNFKYTYTSLTMFVLAFVDQLVRGPLGEELGWRGFAMNELQKRYSPLKSSLIVGITWGFAHTPLWFASGYIGLDLIQYIVLFMIGIISFSVIVTVFFQANRNLWIPILFHQLFNFSLVLIDGELLDILVWVMFSYFAFALLFILINPKGVLYNKK